MEYLSLKDSEPTIDVVHYFFIRLILFEGRYVSGIMLSAADIRVKKLDWIFVLRETREKGQNHKELF